MQSKLLQEIILKARDYQQQSLAVFDLDSTLFDVTPRLEQILQDYANDPLHQKDFPDSVAILKNIKMLSTDWGIKNALFRAGLDTHHPEFHRSIREYWRKHFFSNSYLHYDLPYSGAVEFVQKLAKNHVKIVYLTGRDVARMGEGSKEVLLKWSFPLNENAQLVLKPMQGMDDAQFKSDWFAGVDTSLYKKIWFFENEPANIHLVRKCHQQVEVVFFDSTHSGRAEPPQDVPAIIHYLLED